MLTIPSGCVPQSKAEAGGAAALDRTLKFDEKTTIADNMDYICKQLNLINLDVVDVEQAPAGLTPDEKRVIDKAVPGAPGFLTV